MLMQLFTALDFHTGYTFEQAMKEVDPISHAGLENLDFGPESPYVLKSPNYADLLLPMVQEGQVKIHAAIVPMRNLYSAAESRRRVTRDAARTGFDPEIEYPGGLWLTRTHDEQESILAIQFYKIMWGLTLFGVRPYMVEFPKFAEKSDYLWTQLEQLMNEHGVTESEFRAAFGRILRKDLIHTFQPVTASPPMEITGELSDKRKT